MAMHGDTTGRGKSAPKGSPKRAPAAPVKKPVAAKTAGADSKAANSTHSKSPLAPKTTVNLPPLAGVRLSTGKAGIKYRDRTDVLMMVLAPGTQVAGVFTQSKTASAPVEWCRKQLAAGSARVLVVNSGNANAFTGKAGQDGVREVAESAAGVVGCRAQEVFMASTGVIGEPLPYQKINKILGQLADSGAAGGWRAAAEAIMTTDTYPEARQHHDLYRRTPRHHQRHRQGLGHDRARHGDDAGFRVHRRQSAGRSAAAAADRRRAALVQLHHRRQRHLDQRHPAYVRHRPWRVPSRDFEDRPTSAWISSRTSSTPCCSTWRFRS